jgi:hypothetical protein
MGGCAGLPGIVRSVVRQFLSLVFKQCSLKSCEAADTRSIIFVSASSFINIFIMLSGDKSIFRGI